MGFNWGSRSEFKEESGVRGGGREGKRKTEEDDKGKERGEGK